eukprot:14272227-Ditylum_brightwellii.AAC.1
MKFLGCFYAFTQGPKKGGVLHTFEEHSDGLFPAPNLGRFGLKHWHWKELYKHLTYATVPCGANEDELDPNWATDQMVDQLNQHYCDNFNHGWKVIKDKQIFWIFMRDQPGGGKKYDQKPRGYGPKCKCLSSTDVNMTTTFEQVKSNKVNDNQECTKEHGAGAV